jgi:hypothetical protein
LSDNLQAEYFHRFGSSLMKLTSVKIEEAYKEKMLETMAAQEQGAINLDCVLFLMASCRRVQEADQQGAGRRRSVSWSCFVETSHPLTVQLANSPTTLKRRGRLWKWPEWCTKSLRNLSASRRSACRSVGAMRIHLICFLNFIAGDACSDVDQWDDAIKEYGEAARLFGAHIPDR